jgi:hypothetical protein
MGINKGDGKIDNSLLLLSSILVTSNDNGMVNVY